MSNIKYEKCRKIERRYYTDTFEKKKMWIDFFRNVFEKPSSLYMSLSLFRSIYQNVLLLRDMTAALSSKFLPHPVGQASGFHW